MRLGIYYNAYFDRIIINLITDFVSNRTVRVCVEGETSEWKSGLIKFETLQHVK